MTSRERSVTQTAFLVATVLGAAAQAVAQGGGGELPPNLVGIQRSKIKTIPAASRSKTPPPPPTVTTPVNTPNGIPAKPGVRFG
ncbi:hypothetical protein Pla133_03170 [Planctomycetes bacterium Pla133]|uniref:Uncharacterized protein n=1 Tax=Engelhardtia mirabilis TaxID=2528011 RepID=A0A518BEE6_9BACT|nr:hypothetical protein Pla133_03170 [Planctomycetes bacterium Pla133]